MMNNLKKERTQRGLTLRQLANELYIPYSSLNQYERGERQPKQEVWQKLADYFDVDVAYIMGLSDIKRVDDDKLVEYLREKTSLESLNLSEYDKMIIGQTHKEIGQLIHQQRKTKEEHDWSFAYQFETLFKETAKQLDISVSELCEKVYVSDEFYMSILSGDALVEPRILHRILNSIAGMTAVEWRPKYNEISSNLFKPLSERLFDLLKDVTKNELIPVFNSLDSDNKNAVLEYMEFLISKQKGK